MTVTVTNNLYTRSERAFAHRRKNCEFKVMHRHLNLTKEADGSFLYSWVWANETKHPFIRVTSDGLAEVLWDQFTTRSICDRTLVHKVVAGGAAYSDTTKNYVHPVRFSPRTYNYADESYPLTKGLVVDTNITATNKRLRVVRFTPDTMKVTDRKASQGVYAYVRRVGEIMDLLFRMGTLQKREWDKDSPTPYHEQYIGHRALNDPALDFNMTEDALVAVAEAAYTAGAARSYGVASGEYVKNTVNGITTTNYKHFPPEVVRANQYKADKNLALQYLRKELKHRHGGFKDVTVYSEGDKMAA